jgi:hypothetical protein
VETGVALGLGMHQGEINSLRAGERHPVDLRPADDHHLVHAAPFGQLLAEREGLLD